MKKLHLEDVRVETFELGAKQDNTRGTVVGNGRTDYCAGDTSAETCEASCNATACYNDCMSSVYIMGHCTMP